MFVCYTFYYTLGWVTLQEDMHKLLYRFEAQPEIRRKKTNKKVPAG